jgi:RNA polymerase sigma-70 factor, ECF subfamily
VAVKNLGHVGKGSGFGSTADLRGAARQVDGAKFGANRYSGPVEFGDFMVWIKVREFIRPVSAAFLYLSELPCRGDVHAIGNLVGHAAGAPQLMEPSADRDLVLRAQGGDKRAFDLLVLKYQQKVASLIGRYIRDPVEAMDVSQEAFVKAYRALPAFRGESAFYTWLYRIAVNTVKNYLVAQGRRPPADDVDAELAAQTDLGERLRENATPERHLLTEEIARTVQDALDSLPDDLRTAIVLRELEGMSYEEISQAMECPIGTVRSRIFRAREAIDKRLRPLLEP